MPDEFVTVAEIAELLRLNQQTVRNMIDRGELPAVRVGKRRVRVRQSDLDAFIAAGSTERQAAESLPAEEVDEGSVTAWATFGAAMADATARLERADKGRAAWRVGATDAGDAGAGGFAWHGCGATVSCFRALTESRVARFGCRSGRSPGTRRRRGMTELG